MLIGASQKSTREKHNLDHSFYSNTDQAFQTERNTSKDTVSLYLLKLSNSELHTAGWSKGDLESTDHNQLTGNTSIVTVFGRPISATSASIFSPFSRACSHRMICATPKQRIYEKKKAYELTFDENVDELNFWFSKSVSVGNVPGASSWSGVNTSGTTSLKSHSS